jgi:hypothetical protein
MRAIHGDLVLCKGAKLQDPIVSQMEGVWQSEDPDPLKLCKKFCKAYKYLSSTGQTVLAPKHSRDGHVAASASGGLIAGRDGASRGVIDSSKRLSSCNSSLVT